MIIGIDFDNTIVNYEDVFYNLARERGIIPVNIGKTKQEVKEFLQKNEKEKEWTELQGIVYGPEILRAEPYQGVIDFFKWCKKNNIRNYIISHKTRFPFIGEKHDLHLWAKKWLQEKGFFNDETGISEDNTFFNLTLQEKIKNVKKLKCTHFIDDLPEVLTNESFPKEIKRTLFDVHKKDNKNNDINDIDENIEKTESWNEYQKKIELEINVNKFIGESTVKICKVSGGRNNRAYMIIKKNEEKLFLKSYFVNNLDIRDRLSTEYSFLSFVWNKGIRNIPQPLKKDKEFSWGLYSYVEGEKIKEVIPEHIKQVLDFWKEINKNKKEAVHLANASEACFNIDDHISCIEKRIKRLEEIEDLQVREFINNKLIPKWKFLQEEINKKNENNDDKKKIDFLKSISLQERCLSPSDFGFHNALINKEGKIFFLDFEYAGWDDPAKMVCDFFCQPEVPVHIEYFNYLLREVFDKDEEGVIRTKMLFPLYQIKWCCIMLNEFIPRDCQRRTFAMQGYEEIQKKEQLKKAQFYFVAAFSKQ